MKMTDKKERLMEKQGDKEIVCVRIPGPLEQSTVTQVVLDDDVGDCVEYKLDVLCVGGTGEVWVDLLGVLLLVQILKLGADELRRLDVRAGP